MVLDHLAARFAADLDALIEPAARVGIAVSGGPDSLALLVLAASARPGLVEAATVDHQLREESAAEAETVATLCKRLGVKHAVLTIDWDVPPAANIQARAREARYAALGQWAERQRLPAIATAHHADDQAETLLMRLARGSGVSGLAGIERSRPLAHGVILVRPVLDWRRDELRTVVDAARLRPVDDPTNADERYDRTRVRSALQDGSMLEVVRLAASASYLAEAEEALRWAAAREFDARAMTDGRTLTFDPGGLPPELQRRLLLIAIEHLAAKVPRGPELSRALDDLRRGDTTTLAGLKLAGGALWRLTAAPKRRPTVDSTRR